MTDLHTWQPIETAPRDGKPILAVNKHGDRNVVAWNPSWRQWQTLPGKYTFHLTHWMPLPEPPEKQP